MATIETIAIVGAAGKLGSAVARSLNGKYRLLLMSDDVEELVELKTELSKSSPGAEVHAVSCAREAAWEADIIIISTPYAAEKDVAEKIREVAVGKIVISISRPLDSSCSQLVTSEDSSAAEKLQRMLPYSRIIKTFNTAFATDLIPSGADRKMRDVFVAGNSGDAVETVSKVIDAAGFNPVLVGDLSVSRALERMQLTLAGLAMNRQL